METYTQRQEHIHKKAGTQPGDTASHTGINPVIHTYRQTGIQADIQPYIQSERQAYRYTAINQRQMGHPKGNNTPGTIHT